MRGVPCLLFTLLASGIVAGQQPQNVPPKDLERAVDEFKTLSRQLGFRADSPQRNSAKKAAAAPFHGRLYHNFRNDFLDATPHDVRQRGGDKNILRRNQFGFNVSGPVILPKLYDGSRRTFFTVNYEGVREKIGRSYLRTIPILAERTGDFSQTVDASGNQLPVYDPSTTRLNPNYDASQPVSTSNLQYLRDPFPGNRIPIDRIDPVALKINSYLPAPNSTAGPFNQNNFFVFNPETNKADGMIIRVDHSFLDKHRLSVNTSFTNGLAGAARYFTNDANPGPADRKYADKRLTAEYIYTASAQSVNTLTVDLMSNNSAAIVEPGTSPQALGLSGITEDQFPLMQIGSYLPMGRAYGRTWTARNTYSVQDAQAMRFGKHNVRFSGELIRYQINAYQPQYASGDFRFSSGLTSLPGIVNTGSAYASFMLGDPYYVELSMVPQPSYFRWWRGVFNAKDTWELRPSLTMSFSLNLEVDCPRTEKYNRISTVDMNQVNPDTGTLGALVFADQNGYGAGLQDTQIRPQPSISLAWSPGGNRKSVLRSSYSMDYSGYYMSNAQWGTQGYNGYQTVISSNEQLSPAMQLSQGMPAAGFTLPDLRPSAADNTTADLVDRSGRLPLYQYANLSYERELPSSFLVSAGAYVYTGKNLYVGNDSANPNAVSPDALIYRDQLNNVGFRQSLRPYPQYLGFDVNGLWTSGRYRRQAGWIRAEKRTSTGLSVNVYYEFSKQFDDYSGPYGKQDYFNWRNEWSLTSWNNPKQLSFTYMYELPFGPGKKYLDVEDWRRFLVSGWSVSGISSVLSGRPLALHPLFNNTGTIINGLRVNTVPGVSPSVSNPSPSLWFNPDAFSNPADFTLGNGPRTDPSLRGPIAQNHDLSISKRIAIDQEKSLEFNASAFNFINHANWNSPDTGIGSASDPNANAGKIIGSTGGRVIQLGLRLSF